MQFLPDEATHAPRCRGARLTLSPDESRLLVMFYPYRAAPKRPAALRAMPA